MPERIDHVAIIVRNLEQALHFYRDTLGIPPREIKDVPTEQVRIAFLPMGGPNGSEIELIQPTVSDSSLMKFLEKRGEGLHHICLQVDDIDVALQDMQAKGASVLDSFSWARHPKSSRPWVRSWRPRPPWPVPAFPCCPRYGSPPTPVSTGRSRAV